MLPFDEYKKFARINDNKALRHGDGGAMGGEGQFKKIDAHHHLWPTPLPWMDDGMEVLKRPYGPEELGSHLDSRNLNGSVVVQAQQLLGETVWLLGLPAEHPFIKGVVGWFDLKDPQVERVLDEHAAMGPLVGAREITQGADDDAFFKHPGFNAGVDALRQHGLAYDILIYHHQLQSAIAFIDGHPGQTFIIDHIAKPNIAKGDIGPWKRGMAEASERERVYVKLSGLVTEAGPEWYSNHLTPYIDATLATFGPDRIMFGSDWPVLNLQSDYQTWHDIVDRHVSGLSKDERGAIFGGTAIKAYRLHV